MKMLLERRGYRITLAHTADQAIEKAQAEKFDLLISDIGLPDRSGYELMKELRAKNSLPRNRAERVRNGKRHHQGARRRFLRASDQADQLRPAGRGDSQPARRIEVVAMTAAPLKFLAGGRRPGRR